MNIKTFGIGCGVVVLALLIFVGYRVANPWEVFRFSGYEVRRNRITERVQLRVGDSWQPALNNTPNLENLPPGELDRIHLTKMAFGPRGYFCGVAIVKGDKPVTGRFAINITVVSKFDGKRRVIESERSLRCNAEFKPGIEQTFLVQTDMTPPSRTEKFTVNLVPINLLTQ